jgi:CheY-like chemotaxis protein
VKGKMDKALFFRILIVEDNFARASILKTWLPKDVNPIVVESAGKAIGLLNRDRGSIYAGIMLDHDLQENTVTAIDRSLNGKDVVDAIIRNIPNSVPIFVHSTNETQSLVMAKRLESLNYWVTKISMNQLTPEMLTEWVDDVRELWETTQGEFEI